MYCPGIGQPARYGSQDWPPLVIWPLFIGCLLLPVPPNCYHDTMKTFTSEIFSKNAKIQDVLGVVKVLLKDAILSSDERRILSEILVCPTDDLIADIKNRICSREDPLGESWCYIKGPAERRPLGQTFSPRKIISEMIEWGRRQNKTIARIVDPGAGSGRYTIAGLKAFPEACAVAVEKDPTMALILRANLAINGVADRTEVIVGDFREIHLPKINGATFFVGNPPYVRHHVIEANWKEWYTRMLARFGHKGSQLAGLHLHFFLKTLELSSPGDIGCYVTSAEWMDVNYGLALRSLLTNGLGGKEVFWLDPKIQVFEDAFVSAVVTGFTPRVHRKNLTFKSITDVSDLGSLSGRCVVKQSRASIEPKWSIFVRKGPSERREGFIELGDLFRVSRGQVTGLNRVWIASSETPNLPDRYLVPAITDAHDITKAKEGVIDDLSGLRRVVSIPKCLEDVEGEERGSVETFLRWAQSMGASETYIAKHRKPWWHVSLKDPAPIVMTYMGRRPPVFALNKGGARLINVAHGLYPVQDIKPDRLVRLVGWLNQNVKIDSGRIYAGGLAKFEPGEAMRIPIPEQV